MAAAEAAAAAAAKSGARNGASVGASVQTPPQQQQPQELYVDGFDAEQIWLQLEMHSEGALKRARRLFKKAGDVPRLVLPEMEEALDGETAYSKISSVRCDVSNVDSFPCLKD